MVQKKRKTKKEIYRYISKPSASVPYDFHI